MIPNPFFLGSQLHWVGRCLIDYPCKPNICNLDAHIARSGEGRLWPEFNSSTTPVSRASSDRVADAEEDTVKRIKLSVVDSASKDNNLYKLRWVTLGYHYDWNTKEYYRDKWSPFPTDLGEMSKFILKASGFPK